MRLLSASELVASSSAWRHDPAGHQAFVLHWGSHSSRSLGSSLSRWLLNVPANMASEVGRQESPYSLGNPNNCRGARQGLWS